jgi:hypothetical protein
VTSFGERFPASSATASPTCPFCEHAVEPWENPRLYPAWKCACGAIGASAFIIPDLDEVADQLLEALGVGGSVSEPSQPIGAGGAIRMQHYDIPRSLDQLQAMLSAAGFELRTNRCATEDGRPDYYLWGRAV